jgi:hypothetical protein
MNVRCFVYFRAFFFRQILQFVNVKVSSNFGNLRFLAWVKNDFQIWNIGLNIEC